MANKKKFSLFSLHTAISWGASVVIVGALFKILHLGGVMGNYMIGIGLGIEALLFFLTGFVPPPEEPQWERVYPELQDGFAGELPSASRPLAISTVPSSSAALDKMLHDANVTPELIESLSAGLRNFGEKVAAINNIADTSLAASEFAVKLKMAAGQFENLGQAFEKASAGLVEMGETNVDSKTYHEQVNMLGKNLASLNGVYELELQDSSVHLKSMNKFYQNLSLTMQNFNESLEDSKQFKEEVNNLAKNLAALNAVYGNMLSAMNQPRA